MVFSQMRSIDYDIYKYTAMSLAATSLIPQFIVGYRTGSLVDISIISQLFMMTSSFLWSFYMYEHEELELAGATSILGFSSFTILTLKFIYYHRRWSSHMKNFEKQTKITVVDDVPQSDNNV
mgnify:CR=1 FL=1